MLKIALKSATFWPLRNLGEGKSNKWMNLVIHWVPMSDVSLGGGLSASADIRNLEEKTKNITALPSCSLTTVFVCMHRTKLLFKLIVHETHLKTKASRPTLNWRNIKSQLKHTMQEIGYRGNSRSNQLDTYTVRFSIKYFASTLTRWTSAFQQVQGPLPCLYHTATAHRLQGTTASA